VRKRMISLLLCMIFFVVSFSAVTGTVHADGDVVVSAEITGNISNAGGKLFISPSGTCRGAYLVQNKSAQGIRIVSAVESVPGGDFSIDLGGKEIGPGESLSFSGRNFTAEAGKDTGNITCRIRYAGAEDQQEQEATGQASFLTINDSMNVTYSSSQQGPVFKGEQTALKVEVQSGANVTLKNLSVMDSDLGKTLGTINALAPGERKAVETTVPLDKETNGNIIIEYDDPLGSGGKLRKTFDTGLKIPIKQEAPVSSLNIAGKPNKKLIPGPGKESVTFKLKIKNTGNTALKNLECLDWNQKVFYTLEQLLPGEETSASFTGTVKPDKTYHLTAQARVEDTNQLIQSSCDVHMDRLQPQVEIERFVVPENITAGEPFVLEYVIRNTGNVDLKDVVLEEPDFGEIDTFEQIEAGQEVHTDKELTIEKDAVSRATLRAKDAVTNENYSYEASELELLIGGGELSQNLSVRLTSKKTPLSKSGTVELKCVIENTGTEPLYNLVLTLMDRRMVIDNLSVLNPGEKKTIPVTTFRVEKTEDFFMEVNGTDEDGEKFTVKSEPLTVKVKKGGLSGKGTLLWVVLVVVVLVCVLIIGALVYLTKGSGKFPLLSRKKHKATESKE